MIFKKPVAKFLNAFSEQPISDRTLTIIDIVITGFGILATTVAILVGYQFGLALSILIAALILGIISIMLITLIVLKRLLPVKDCPYTPWTPVTPPRFVGRKRLFSQLALALETNESISLVGDRRIGKTSVLKTWQQQVRAQKRLVIYISGEQAGAATLSDFVQKITKCRASNNPEEAADVLSEWALKKLDKSGFPPLILVDEAERFTENLPPRFFERLRGMLGRVVWIFASLKDIDLIYRQFHHSTSPFENRFAIHRLGLLEPEAVEKLIQWGKLTQSEADLMHSWAGRHPFFLQLLGRRFWEAGGKAVQMVVDDVQEEEAPARLRLIWENLSEAEQQALTQCITGKPASLPSLRVNAIKLRKKHL